jgi:hypothetical protein
VAVSLFASTAAAGVPSGALFWARAGFSRHDEAIEHLTVRGRAADGSDTFIRISVANAAFKDGELTATFRHRGPKSDFYCKESFKRGRYSVPGDRLALVAGKHRMDMSGGNLVFTFDNGKFQATATLSSSSAPLNLRDVDPTGFVERRLLVPIGRLAVKVVSGSETLEVSETAFAVHEASTIKAHRVYERSLQMHRVGGSMLLLDYLKGPPERKGRVLGFLVVRGKGHTFIGKVASESRGAEKKDPKFGYLVPYAVTATAATGETAVKVTLTGKRQVERVDDLAKLPALARKAVGLFMHPVSYDLTADWTVELTKAGAAAETWSGTGRYRYAQVRK